MDVATDAHIMTGDATAEVASPVDRRDRRLHRAATVLATVPIISSAVINGASGWFPTRDAAYTTVWITDVFSAHTPLHGQPMRFPSGTVDIPHYPGVVHHWFLAVPVELFGVSWGLPIGMALLNTGWVLMALWLVRRRVGYRWGLVGCAVVALLVWSLGSQMLIDPTPVQTGPLAFFACCVAAWSVADVDSRGLVPLALTSSYLFLTHPQYVLVVPAMAALAVAIAAVRLRGVRRGVPAQWRRTRRPWLRGTIAAGATTALLWAPAMIDQVFRPGGNLRIWFSSMLHQSGDSGHRILDVVRVVSAPLTVPPFWLRDSIAHPAFGSTGPTASAVLQIGTSTAIGAVIVAAVVLASRRDDLTAATGIAIGIVAWCAWVVTVHHQPGRGYINAYLVTSWPLAAFITMMVVFSLPRNGRMTSRRADPTRRRVLGPLAVGAIGIVAVAAIPTVDQGVSTTRENITTANRIREAIRERVEPGSPILVSAHRYPTRAYLPTVILELEDMGIPVRVPPGRETMLYRSFRGLDRDRPDADRRLVLTSAPSPALDGAELIAAGGDPLREPFDTYLERSRALEAWAESTSIHLAPAPAIDPDERRVFNTLLADLHADGTPVFDSEAVILGLSYLDEHLAGNTAELVTALAVPDLSADQFRAWLEDRRTILANGRWFVYLEPL